MEYRQTTTMRVLWIVGLVVASGGVARATLQMETALTDLRSGHALALVLEGEEIIGRRATPVRVNTYFMDSPELGPRLEQFTYKDEALARRVVADGSVFVDYDPRINQYTSERYDGSAGRLSTLMRMLKGTVNGTSAAPIRLLSDVYAPANAIWQPWLSVVQPVTQNNWESYIATDERFDFKLIPITLSSWRLTQVAYRKDGGGKTSTWLMDVFPGFVNSTLSFRFVPPRGAKAVASPSSAKTGSG